MSFKGFQPLLLLLVTLWVARSNAIAEYRYALIMNDGQTAGATAAVQLLKRNGFECTEATWRSDRDLRSGLAEFMSKTATNSTLVVLYSGQVTIVESKSKEHRGETSLGIRLPGGTAAYPLVDLVHLIKKVGGSRTHHIFLETSNAIQPPQRSLPDGFSVTMAQPAHLMRQMKRRIDSLTEAPSTPLSSPNQFVTGKRLGDEWVNHRGMIFRWCPPGSFTDKSGQRVEIKDGFWLMKYEWTRGQIMGKGDLRQAPGDHKLQALGKFGFRELPSLFKRFNAEERKAGRLPDGYEYALPTEAQWEYAARAGSSASYCFGDDPAQLVSFGNFADKSYYDTASVYSNYGHRTFDDGQAGVAPVGQYQPNAWGFYDVHGNVSEYCDNGACRGGSWISTFDSCRFDFRDGRWGHHVGEYQGYRFVIRKVVPKANKTNEK